ncbi:MAG: type II secretion system F family protein [Candidatus Woesearchaeota archaeon]
MQAYIRRFFHGLKLKLLQAGINYGVEEFIKRTLITSLYFTVFLSFIVFVFAKELKNKFLYLLIPVIFIFSFQYFLKLPEVIIRKKERMIGNELVFAGRFLIVELESGVTIYNSIINLSKNFKVIGSYFQQIINKVNMGSTMEEAITEVIEITPSQNFRRILWQLLNSLKTGADVAQSLNAVVEQITREQMIEIQEYGRKLNPLAMFYMMIAVIVPTLGLTILVIIGSFLGINIGIMHLLLIALFIGFIQFMFMAIINSARPSVGF